MECGALVRPTGRRIEWDGLKIRVSLVERLGLFRSVIRWLCAVPFASNRFLAPLGEAEEEELAPWFCGDGEAVGSVFDG